MLSPDHGKYPTSIQLLFQLVHFHDRSTDPVDSHCLDAVLFNGLAAFHDNQRHINVIPGHLLPQVDTKGRSSPVNPIWALLGGVYTLQMGRQWGQLEDMKRSANSDIGGVGWLTKPSS